MGKMINKIKQQEQLSPPDILAGLIWDRAVNAKGHVFRTPYYRFPCYIEYVHDNDDDGFRIDIYYLQQETSFMILRPDYKSIRAVSPEILQWLDATYGSCAPIEPTWQSRRAKKKFSPLRQRAILQRKNPLTTNLGKSFNTFNKSTQQKNRKMPNNSQA